MRALVLPAVLGAGCNPVDTVVEGEVAGRGLSVQSAWWGGPFVVLLDQPTECTDMHWVDRYYFEGEAQVEDDLVDLQLTWVDDEVSAGLYDVSGQAAVSAYFLVHDGGAFTPYKASSGQVTVDEVEAQGDAVGSFDLQFDAGTITGSFQVEWCTNLQASATS
jgi:hypothetical protein